MGLRVNIYRSDYDSDMNVFHGKKQITVVNIDGPFKDTEDAPAAYLQKRSTGGFCIVPADDFESGVDGVQMNGGTFASCCDSRWNQYTEGMPAVPIHDRRESWADYDKFSR